MDDKVIMKVVFFLFIFSINSCSLIEQQKDRYPSSIKKSLSKCINSFLKISGQYLGRDKFVWDEIFLDEIQTYHLERFAKKKKKKMYAGN